MIWSRCGRPCGSVLQKWRVTKMKRNEVQTRAAAKQCPRRNTPGSDAQEAPSVVAAR